MHLFDQFKEKKEVEEEQRKTRYKQEEQTHNIN